MAQLINGTTIAGHTAIHAGNLAAHSIATTSYVTTQISNLINGAPGALDTLNELAAALGNDASFSSTLTNSLAAKLSLSGGTLTGKVLFPSAVSNRPQFPGGILGLDTGDGNFDIWGISRDYYPSHSNASNAWGLRWNGDNNDFEFVGGGSNRVVLDMDGGNLTASGIVYASGGNSGNWNTAYGWGNHAGLYSALGHTHDDRYYTETEIGNFFSGSSAISGYNKSNWDTAYGWGNHASSGYQTTSGTVANIASGSTSDLNAAWTAPGSSIGNGFRVYRYDSSATNKPASVDNANWLINIYSHPSGGTASYGHQISAVDNESIYVRSVINGSFGSWRTLYHSGNLTNLNQLTNGPGYITGITSGMVTTALGYTPYNSTNPNGYITGITSGMVTTALGYTPANSSHNHDGVYVRAYTTTNDNIDSDWGQSFKTFDPVPSGTPPIASPNLRTINIGENFSRRTQLAFNYATDQAWFRRNQDGTWYSWREFFHTGNFTDNSSNWNTAYSKRPTAISFSGGSTKTLTLTQGDGSTLTASFSDIDTDTNTDAQTLSISGNTLSISGGNSVTLSSSGISQATADGLYVAKAGGSTVAGITYFSNGESLNLYGIRGRYSGDGIHLYGRVDIGNPSGWGAGIGNAPTYGLSTFGGAYFAYNQGTVSVGALGTAKLHVIGNTSGQELFAVDGVNGRLFSVVDDLSDSLYSVNTIAGLPVLEVFANNIVTIGKFGTNAIYVGQDGRVGFGTTDFSYTAADQTSPTNNRLFVNGSIQLLGNNDAIVFGRGTATVLRDEKLAFGWGGGWFMEDATYLRVVGNKTVYSGGDARFDSNIYIGGASYYLYQANSGIWTNGNLGASGDLYLGTRGTWLSSWLNQSVQTGASPTFNDIYADNWFRNNGSNEGLYNQSTTQHWSSNTNGYWDASSTTSVSSIRFYTGGHVTSLRGYVYANSSNEIGFLNSAGNWGLRMDNSYNVQIYGTLSATNFSGSHSGTSSGTNTGDQTNISGNAATATNVAWTGVTGRPTALSQFTNDLGNYGGWITSSGSISGNAATATAAQGATFTTQGNSTWGGRLQIGGNGSGSGVATIAVVQATDGNLHMDNGLGKSMYLNYYHNGTIYLNGSTYSISSNGSYYNGTAAAANSVAWTNVSSRPTALSQFTNDLGNYGGWITSSGSISGNAATVTINYNNDSNSTYQMLWGSGNSVYGTAGVYVNPNSDTIYSGGLRGSANVGGTGEATWHPAGIYSGSTQWLYGHTYRNQSHTYGQGYIYQDGNYGYGLVGLYASTRFQAIFAMGDSYKQAVDGTGLGSLYGLSWTHSNVGGQGSYVSGHQLLVVANGQTLTAISNDIWARGNISANGGVYDSGSRVAISRGEGRNYVDYSRYVYNNGAYSGSGWIEPSDLGVRYANSAGSLSNMNISQFSNNSGYITSSASISGNSNGVAITGFGSGNFSFYQDSGTFGPFSGWHNYFIGNHGNGSNYYNTTIAMPFWGVPKYARMEGGTQRGPWEFITGENIASQSVSNSDTVDGYHASNFLGYNGNSYYQVNTWLQMNGTHGIYWPSYNGAHLYVNTTTSYTQFRLDGSRGGYGGIWDSYSAVHGIMYDSAGNGGVYREANGRWYWYHHIGNNCTGISTSTTSSSYRAYIGGSLYAEGDIVAYSDARKKTDIVTIDNALDKVLQLRGVYYTRIDETEKGRQTGVIAQEINEVLPEVVTYAQDVDEYGVKYGNIAGILIEAVKEQQKQIAELKEELKKLRGE